MRYVDPVYRPPSEGQSYILQASLGCSHNLCTYCAMYREKPFRIRPLEELLEEIELARATHGPDLAKVFVADGDALVMPLEHWTPILRALREAFPRLKRVSCYATAINLLAKTPAELSELREQGLTQLYIGPESGDPLTLKRLVKGAGFEEHVEAAAKAKQAGMKLSAIFLLGAGGVERSAEHALGSAKLATAMDPEFLAALTLTIVPGTPLARLADSGRFELPGVTGVLRELRTFVAESKPTRAMFRTNHASNYLPLAGHLPQDSTRILSVFDGALAGEVGLRPEWARGL